eukprot:gene2394-5341_t
MLVTRISELFLVAALVIYTHGVTARQREYFISADVVDWSYIPVSTHNTSTSPLINTNGTRARMENAAVNQKKAWMERSFTKAMYRAYTNETFRELQPIPAQWEHLGVLGPIIRAEVGDTVEVRFRNALDIPASIHAHGITGMQQTPKIASPGETITYTWLITEDVGPGPQDGSSIAWLYHNHSSTTPEIPVISAGLIGILVIAASGSALENGAPADVDHEFVIGFTSFNEDASPYSNKNFQNTRNSTSPTFANELPKHEPSTHAEPAIGAETSQPMNNSSFNNPSNVIKSSTSPASTVSKMADLSSINTTASISPTPSQNQTQSLLGGAATFSNNFTALNKSSTIFDDTSDTAAISTTETSASYFSTPEQSTILEEKEIPHQLLSVNGFTSRTKPKFLAHVGDRIRWYSFALGDDEAVHVAHWPKATILHQGHRVDAVELVSPSVVTADMYAKEAGEWSVFCTFGPEEPSSVVYATYTVLDADPSQFPESKVSTEKISQTNHPQQQQQQQQQPVQFKQHVVTTDSARTATITTVIVVLLAVAIVCVSVIYKRHNCHSPLSRGSPQYRPMKS